MSLRARVAMVVMLVCAAPTAEAQGRTSTHAAERVAERIVDLRLTDAAVAVADSLRPVIYYNPQVLNRFGPAMATFILAHEDAHITHRHTRSVGGVTDPARLRRLELEADCAAAQTLAVSHPDAISAAVRFFAALGRERIDNEHPSGAERASRIKSCAASAKPGETSGSRPVRANGGDNAGDNGADNAAIR